MSSKRILPRILAIADRFGVRVQPSCGPDDPVFAWSWNQFGYRSHPDYATIGPKVVYADPRRVCDPETRPWAVLLHEVGHAYCETDDENVVAGWTTAVAATISPYAKRTMRRYDITAGYDDPMICRNAAIGAGFLAFDGSLMPESGQKHVAKG
jgi:hypothetical protein